MSTASDYWTITDRAGDEIARVHGETYTDAAESAAKLPEVRASRDREGGYGLRRLRSTELGMQPEPTVDDYAAAARGLALHGLGGHGRSFR